MKSTLINSIIEDLAPTCYSHIKRSSLINYSYICCFGDKPEVHISFADSVEYQECLCNDDVDFDKSEDIQLGFSINLRSLIDDMPIDTLEQANAILEDFKYGVNDLQSFIKDNFS